MSTTTQRSSLSSSRHRQTVVAAATATGTTHAHAHAPAGQLHSPFATPPPKQSSLSRTKSKQARAARSRLARKRSSRLGTTKRMSSLRRSFSRTLKAFSSTAENTMPLTRRGSSDAMDTVPSLGGRRTSLGDRLHSTNPLVAAPSLRPTKLNRRGMLALHFQSFVANRGDPMAALNPVSGVASSAARNAAEAVTTSMDVVEAFQDKAPLKQLTGKEIAAHMARGESMMPFTPFG